MGPDPANSCPDLPGVTNVSVFYDDNTYKDRMPGIARPPNNRRLTTAVLVY